MSATIGRVELLELDAEDCRRLLAEATIGRVIFTLGALPTAEPVAFVLDDGEIVFRTSGGGKLVSAVRNAVVAFEADDIDLEARTGWSVVAVGEAYEVTDRVRCAALLERLPTPWVPGPLHHVIAIPTRRLTGRRLVRSVTA